jgi:hypothetical protein
MKPLCTIKESLKHEQNERRGREIKSSSKNKVPEFQFLENITMFLEQNGGQCVEAQNAINLSLWRWKRGQMTYCVDYERSLNFVGHRDTLKGFKSESNYIY